MDIPLKTSFSNERKEPIESKLVYCGQITPSIKRCKRIISDVKQDLNCTNFPDNLIICSYW